MPTSSPSAHVKRGWYWNPQTGNLEAYNNGNEIFQYPYGTSYYVTKADAAGVGSGVDTNSGLSWAQSFLTIGAAMTAAASAGTGAAARRGGVKIFVAGGYYAESLTTPTNAQCPFGQLIGYSPADVSRGCVYVASGATDEPWLTVLARGWRISGFEVECPTGAAGILMDSTTGNAAYTQVDHCHLTGGLKGIEASGAPNYVHILDNEFSLIDESGGAAITATVGINCNVWTVENNRFVANANDILFDDSTAPYSGLFKGNTFFGPTSAKKVFLHASASGNVITQNFFGGTYSKSGGYEGDNGGTDEWFGNYANVTYGITVSDPA